MHGEHLTSETQIHSFTLTQNSTQENSPSSSAPSLCVWLPTVPMCINNLSSRIWGLRCEAGSSPSVKQLGCAATRSCADLRTRSAWPSRCTQTRGRSMARKSLGGWALRLRDLSVPGEQEAGAQEVGDIAGPCFALAGWAAAALAGSCTQGCAAPNAALRDGGALLRHGRGKAAVLPEAASFYGREVRRQPSIGIHKRIYGCSDKLLDRIRHDLITSLKLMWSLDVLHSDLGGIYFLQFRGWGDMFSMWKFSKLTEFHSHQSSHTAQQMIQSLQRDFICADSNPLT